MEKTLHMTLYIDLIWPSGIACREVLNQRIWKLPAVLSLDLKSKHKLIIEYLKSVDRYTKQTHQFHPLLAPKFISHQWFYFGSLFLIFKTYAHTSHIFKTLWSSCCCMSPLLFTTGKRWTWANYGSYPVWLKFYSKTILPLFPLCGFIMSFFFFLRF